MKIHIENLGPLRQADFELADLTIICGENNTGKTYATYSLFGFLVFWREAFDFKVSEDAIGELLSKGSTKLQAKDFIKETRSIIDRASKDFGAFLPSLLASSQKHFRDTKVKIHISEDEIKLAPQYKQTTGATKEQIFEISKIPDSDEITITLLVEKSSISLPTGIIVDVIGDAVKEIIFGNTFPQTFIASAERTGAAIFRKELDFARNRLLEQMKLGKDINPLELLRKVFPGYAMPVTRNVDFLRRLEEVSKNRSFIVDEYSDLLCDFEDIVGGGYKVIKEELFFEAKKSKARLTMSESSSAVRSLLDIGFYLRHVAQKGDLLIVDEPELNLHPENQRRVARLFARLVNIGIKVFITTHSDYIIKELNTLIMLNAGNDSVKPLMEKEGYKAAELISPDKIRVYVAEEARIKLPGSQRKQKCLTLVPAIIDEKFGIEAGSFDKTIDDMNRIQEEIMAVEDDE